MFRDRRGRYTPWFVALMMVSFIVIVFVHWKPALIALAVVMVIAALGQLAGLWHPNKK